MEVQKLNQQLDERERDLKTVTAIADTLLEQNKTLKRELESREQDMMAKLHEAARLYDAAVSELESKKEALFNFTQEMQYRDQAFQDDMELMNNKHKTAMTSVEKKCESLEKENEVLKHKVQECDKRELSRGSGDADLRRHMEEMMHCHDTEVDTLHTENNDLNKKLAALQEQYNKETTKSAAHRDKIGALTASLEHSQKQIRDYETLANKYDEERSKSNVLSKSLVQANKTIEELKEALEITQATTSGSLTSMTADPNSLWTDLDDGKRRAERGLQDLTKQHHDLEEQHKMSEDEKASLKRHILKLKREALQPISSATTSESTSRALAEAKTMISTLESEIRRLKERTQRGGTQSEQIKYLELDNDKLRRQYETQMSMMMVDKERHVASEKRLCEMENRMDIMIKENKALTFDLQDANDKLKNLESRMNVSVESYTTQEMMDILSKRGVNVDAMLLEKEPKPKRPAPMEKPNANKKREDECKTQ